MLMKRDLTMEYLSSEENLAEVILENKNDYYRIAYSFLGNEADALDAVSEMTYIILKKIKQLKKADSFYSWSKTILVNCCRKMLKQNKNNINLDYYAEHLLLDEEKDSELVDVRNDLTRSIKMLKTKYQEVIVMNYFLEMNYKEISDILKIPVGTVKSRLSTGIRKLKKKLGGEYTNE